MGRPTGVGGWWWGGDRAGAPTGKTGTGRIGGSAGRQAPRGRPRHRAYALPCLMGDGWLHGVHSIHSGWLGGLRRPATCVQSRGSAQRGTAPPKTHTPACLHDRHMQAAGSPGDLASASAPWLLAPPPATSGAHPSPLKPHPHARLASTAAAAWVPNHPVGIAVASTFTQSSTQGPSAMHTPASVVAHLRPRPSPPQAPPAPWSVAARSRP